nr:MAG TPA: hypothetical protein [Caudoviricetes sp.]
MMVTQDTCIFLCIVCSFLTGVLCYFIGKWNKEDKHTTIKGTKLKLIEGIDGVTSVQLTPIRYVELLTKEEECNELKLAIKRFADETPKGT